MGAPVPHLERYDWIVLNSSAGKDSQAMLDFVSGPILDRGLKDRTVVVHADLGRYEWPGVPELAREQAQHYGFRFEIVQRRQNGLLEHVLQRRRWPAKFQRYCTSDHKRGPIRTLFTTLTKESKKVPVRILNCMGMRAEESTDRAKMPPFQSLVKPSNSRKEIDQWLPIHDWTTTDVWSRIKTSGVRHHEAYDLGMPRLSCMFCIFASKQALMVAGRANRGLLDEYIQVEREIGHTFRHKFSIATVAEAIDRGDAVEDVPNWRA